MKKQTLRWALAILLLLVSALASSCGSRDPEDTTAPTTTAPTTTAPVVVTPVPDNLFTLNLPETLGSMEGKYDIAFSAETVLARFLATRDELPTEVTVLEPVPLSRYPQSAAREIYVSPSGSDTAAGTREAPLASLDCALEKMAGGGGVIFLYGGNYVVTETVNITSRNSGTREQPLFIKAMEGEEPVFTANRPLSTEDGKWGSLDATLHASVFSRIPEEARSHIRVTTLAAQGFTEADIPAITKENGPPFMYVGGEEYCLARFPNASAGPLELAYFTHTYDTGTVTLPQSTLRLPWEERAAAAGKNPDTWMVGWELRVLNQRDNENDKNSLYHYGEEILSWVNTGDIWFYGSTYSGWEEYYYNLALETEGAYWAHDEDGNLWSPESGKTPYLGTPKEDGYYSLKSVQPNIEWGCNPSANSAAGRNTFFLFNAVEALDAPGEWFYEKETGNIYLYPKAEHSELSATTVGLAGVATHDLVKGTGLSFLVVDGLCFDGSSRSGLVITNSENVVVQNCTFRNMKRANLEATSSKRVAVIHSDFSAAYFACIVFGNWSTNLTLEPSEYVFQNNIVHHPKVQEAMYFGGCRPVISHNYFNNTTIYVDSAIEAIVEYNRFEGGSNSTTDGGMIYASGPRSRANHYRYNLFHMFSATHNAVYNDTMCNGNYMYYNVFSALHSRSDHNTAWYSSSGWGNVAYGNLIILRNPTERLSAGSNASFENDGTYAGAYDGDSLLESAHFYYHGGETVNSYEKWHPVAYDGEKQRQVNPNGLLGLQPILSQSECGLVWYEFKRNEVNYYLRQCDRDAWCARAPEYINTLKVTRMLLDFRNQANADPNDAIDYHIKYFYVPWYLSGKSHTFEGIDAGTVITVPPYQYLEEGESSMRPRMVTTEARDIVVDGPVTLTYEEIAAIERGRRAGAHCVVMNNLVFGGTPEYEQVGGRYKSKNVSNYKKVLNDRLEELGYFGYLPSSKKENNLLLYSYDALLPYAKLAFDYSLSDGAWATIAAAGASDANLTLETSVQTTVREALEAAAHSSGPTWNLDYSEWFHLVYPNFSQ